MAKVDVKKRQYALSKTTNLTMFTAEMVVVFSGLNLERDLTLY